MKFPIPFVILFLSTLTPAFAQDATPDPATMTGEQMLAHCQEKWGKRASTVAPTTTSGVSYVRTGGAAWAPVAQPTVVSIHNIGGMAPDTLHITSLEHPTARKTCGGEGAELVVFLDHGAPVTNVFAPAGAPTGFVEVYYDKNADGTPDGTVMALDLSTQTDVWITWGQANDLTVRYLRPGAQIAVAGLPLQTVYHPTTRAETSASGAIGCDRDKNARRGGHQAIPAYSLSRMW